MANNADRVVETLLSAGVRRLFGTHAASSSELAAAAGRANLPFTAAHRAEAAAYMACAYAEAARAPGAVLAASSAETPALIGPLSHARADEIPLMVLTDCGIEESAMLARFARRSASVEAPRICEDLQSALASLRAQPSGPVHLNIPTEVLEVRVAPGWSPPAFLPSPEAAVNLPEEPRRLLRQARRPVLLLGAGASSAAAAHIARELAAYSGIPVLVTAKSKGAVPDRHGWFAGVLRDGGRGNPLLARADLFLFAGFDPEDLRGLGWPFQQPSLMLNSGTSARALEAAAAELPERSAWTAYELQALLRIQRQAIEQAASAAEVMYGATVALAASAWPDAVAVIDPGPHQAAAIREWPAQEPDEFLTPGATGLDGYGLPAAIGAALLRPARAVALITSQAGVLAALPELETAARHRLRLRILAFTSVGSTIDWAGLGASLGVPSSAPRDEASLRTALAEAAAFPRPALITRGEFG